MGEVPMSSPPPRPPDHHEVTPLLATPPPSWPRPLLATPPPRSRPPPVGIRTLSGGRGEPSAAGKSRTGAEPEREEAERAEAGLETAVSGLGLEFGAELGPESAEVVGPKREPNPE